MIFTETDLKGAFLIDMERKEDERGFFARTWCGREFAAHGLSPVLKQCSISFNRRKGTLRGMHYQAAPHQETRLVRCVRGRIHDVIIDLRADSAAFKRHFAVQLDCDTRRMLYVPDGFAHGFLTLEDDVEVFYQMSEYYEPQCSRGVRWDDPAFGISWPIDVKVISGRDRTYADFNDSTWRQA